MKAVAILESDYRLKNETRMVLPQLENIFSNFILFRLAAFIFRFFLSLGFS